MGTTFVAAGGSLLNLNSQWGVSDQSLTYWYGKTWSHSVNLTATSTSQNYTSGNDGYIQYYLTYTQVQTGTNPTTGTPIYTDYVNLVLANGGALPLLTSFSWSYGSTNGSATPNGAYTSGSATQLGQGNSTVSSVSLTFNMNHD
jgi:hypothetical protein